MFNTEEQEFINEYNGKDTEVIATITYLGQGGSDQMAPVKVGRYFKCYLSATCYDTYTKQDLGTLNLRWLGKKQSLFGFKYGYDFKINKSYLLNLRHKDNNNYLIMDLIKEVDNDTISNELVIESNNNTEKDMNMIIKCNGFDLKYDDIYKSYNAYVDYNNTKIMFIISDVTSDESIRINKINNYYSNLLELDNKFKEAIYDKYYNEVNSYSDKELTKEEFINNLELNIIEPYDNGTTEISYDANNMFGDHSVIVYLDDKDNISDIAIEG